MSTHRLDRDQFAANPEPGRGYSAVDAKDPEAIKSNIDRTRAEMDETVDALQHKLSLNYVLDRAIGNLRDSSGRSRVLEIIRDNPIPAAMVGVGLAWLMVDHNAGPRVGRSRSIPKGRPDDIGRGRDEDWLAPGAEYYESGGRSSGPGFMKRMKNKVSDLGEQVSDTAHSIGDRVRGGFESAKDRVGDIGDRASQAGSGIRGRVSDVGHHASDMGHNLRDRASDLGHDLGRRASHVGHDLRDRADHARHAAVRTYEDNPLIMGAGALAVGLVLGLAFPTTRAENKLMGEASDELGRKARRLGEDALEGAHRVAERTVETVREEAGKEQGGLVGAVKSVADKAVNTVKEEARKEGNKVIGRDDDRGTPSSADSTMGVRGTGSAQISGQNKDQGSFAKNTSASDSFNKNKPKGPGQGI